MNCILTVAYVFENGKLRRLGGDIISAVSNLGDGAEALMVRRGDRRIFLTEGNVKPLWGVPAVSCGMSERDSVSVSSAGEESVMLSVRRTLPTVLGDDVCVQDIALGSQGDIGALALRGGALLCLGVEPENLKNLL